MDRERWQLIQKIFHDSADLPEAEQAAFVENACGGDAALRSDVLEMLDADAHGASLLDHGVATFAAKMLDKPSDSQGDFGAYRILRVLGEGGMGVVHLAERKDLGSFVAIKILRDASMSPARRNRFTREQRTLAKLIHPSIARLYDADTLPDGTPWFAMEFVEGVSLTEYCSARASSIEAKLHLLRAVCEAVQYAHSLAVIHRDLKPSNILVEANGKVKLLDFGIAKQLDTEESADQTRTALRLMTPAYAAPEQVRGEPIGVYTDVYALGVILYELLTGRLPFDVSKGSPAEIAAIVTEQDAEKPSAVAVENNTAKNASWADLDVLCFTAMQKAPEKRYRSAEAFLRDIDHYLAGEPLEARPDTFGYRISKFVRRNRRSIVAYGLFAACIVALIVFYTFRLSTARNAAIAEAARTQRLLRFTLNLFSGGDGEAGPARDLRVTTLIDRGVAEARTLDREPEVQGELHETLGQVYQKLGELDRADALLGFALDRRKALYGTDSAKAAETQVELGLLRVDQARFDDAERLIRDSLEILKRKWGTHHSAVAAATHALGKVLEERGSYPEAIKVLDEAVRLRSVPGAELADLVDSLLELANSHFYAGDYPEAEVLNRRLIKMHREMYGERHPLVAEDLINLGAIQQELAHYKEAEAFDRQALEITQGFYGKDHYKTASNLTLIARALVKQNRYDEAEELLHRALTIQENVFGRVHPRVASAVNEIGSVALARDRFDEAEAAFKRIVDIYKSVYAAKHYLIGIAEANLGSVYAAKK